jgi:hypothetical protein
MPGGVCQILDYEVELMADYVSEMVTRIVLPHMPVNQPFRKFCSQILTSTRLPSTTILLGMNYLAKRVNMMAAAGHTTHTEGQIWRMLTISLLLGSKFLDDNTFQNKSWSEVSGIPVHELNSLEYEWLGAINWCLYVNLDESKDYNAWLNNWKEWLENKKRAQAQAKRERLAALASPVEPEVARPRNSPTYATWHQQQVAEYERLSSMKHAHAPQPPAYRREQTNWSYNSWHAAPLTPPDSGYGTPEYSNSATSVNTQYNEWFDRAVTNTATGTRQYQQPATFNPYHQQSTHVPRAQAAHAGYYNYGQSIWEPTVAECSCMNCTGHVNQKPPPYFATHSYGQPVVG